MAKVVFHSNSFFFTFVVRFTAQYSQNDVKYILKCILQYHEM